MKDTKIFIVLQGPLSFYSKVSRCYKGMNNIIWSVWETERNVVKDEKYVVVNSYPKVVGNANFFYQQKSTLAGLKEAKRLGATHAFKLRADMEFSDVKTLLDSLIQDDQRIYFPGWHEHHGGYFMDFFQFGPIEKMITLWDITPSLLDQLYQNQKFKKMAYKILKVLDISTLNTFRRIPEIVLTENYFKHFSSEKVKYILPILNEMKMSCYWHKYETYFDQFTQDPKYRGDVFCD